MTSASVWIMVCLTSPWTPDRLDVRVSAPNQSTSGSGCSIRTLWRHRPRRQLNWYHFLPVNWPALTDEGFGLNWTGLGLSYCWRSKVKAGDTCFLHCLLWGTVERPGVEYREGVPLLSGSRFSLTCRECSRDGSCLFSENFYFFVDERGALLCILCNIYNLEKM